MRFGYGLLTAQRHPDDPRPWADLYREAVEYGELADRAGLDSFWTSEHHFVDDGYLAAQLPVLAAVAARTERIRLGTGVLLAPMFDPLRLAEDAATVDLLSGGRLILGLGIGWRDEEFEGFGIADDRARAPARRDDRGAAPGLGRWAGDRRRPHVHAIRGPGSTSRPSRSAAATSPIWIGAGAEPAVRRAGRIADGYLGSSASPAAIAERAAWVRDEAESVGRDPATIEIGVHRMTFAWRGPDAWSRVARRGALHVLEVRGHGPGPRVDRAPPAARDGCRDLGRAPLPHDRRDARAGRGRHPRLRPDPRRRRLVRFRGHFPGLDPSVQREAFDVLVEEVVPLLRG